MRVIRFDARRGSVAPEYFHKRRLFVSVVIQLDVRGGTGFPLDADGLAVVATLAICGGAPGPETYRPYLVGAPAPKRSWSSSDGLPHRG